MILHHDMQQIQKRGTDQKVPRFFVLIILFAFASVVVPLCAKKKSNVLNSSNRSIVVRQTEAQMVDMPLPVGGVLVPSVNKESTGTLAHQTGTVLIPEETLGKGSVLTYRVVTTRESLVSFYEDEMMRLGWNKLAQSSGDEEILIFESPLKVAIIQMRPEKPKKGWKRNKKIILTLHQTAKETGTEF